jgi:hypothetical protein
MRDTLKSGYLWASLCALLLGLGAEWWATRYPPESEEISLVKNGVVERRSLLKAAPQAEALRLSSVLLYTLGASVFISVFVTARLESASKRQDEERLHALQTRINEDVFEGLFKTLIPDEILEVIKDSIIRSKVIRKNAQWSYDFAERDGGGIAVKQTLMYEIHNVTQENVINPVKARTDGQGALIHAQITLDGHNVVTYKGDAGENKGLKFSSEDGLRCVEFEVTIPPGKYVNMTLVWSETYPTKHPVRDAYFTSIPLINARLIATFPREFEFSIFQAMSSPLRLTLDEAGRDAKHHAFPLEVMESLNVRPIRLSVGASVLLLPSVTGDEFLEEVDVDLKNSGRARGSGGVGVPVPVRARLPHGRVAAHLAEARAAARRSRGRRERGRRRDRRDAVRGVNTSRQRGSQHRTSITRLDDHGQTRERRRW